MECNVCRKRPRVAGIEYCRYCICKVVERRFRKAVGRAGVISLPSGGKSSLPAAVARHLAGKEGIKFMLSAKAGFSASCADDDAAGFLEAFISPGYRPGRIPGIFSAVTEKELEIYASVKRIKYTKGRPGFMKGRIQGLDARYPGAIRSLAGWEKNGR